MPLICFLLAHLSFRLISPAAACNDDKVNQGKKKEKKYIENPLHWEPEYAPAIHTEKCFNIATDLLLSVYRSVYGTSTREFNWLNENRNILRNMFCSLRNLRVKGRKRKEDCN